MSPTEGEARRHSRADRLEPAMTDRPDLTELDGAVPFSARHIGPDRDEQERMLQTLGFASLQDLMQASVPEVIRTDHTESPLRLPAPVSETAALQRLRELAGRNRPLEPMIGLGYYSTVTPGVIRRRVLESPAWYTAYTPYQPEISQGRLEALLNFQTMVADLTGLPTANAPLLDEATAAAEAMTLVRRADRKRGGGAFVVDADTFPQTVAVVRTRAEALGIEVQVRDVFSEGLPDGEISGVLLQYPGTSGVLRDPEGVIEQTKEGYYDSLHASSQGWHEAQHSLGMEVDLPKRPPRHDARFLEREALKAALQLPALAGPLYDSLPEEAFTEPAYAELHAQFAPKGAA